MFIALVWPAHEHHAAAHQWRRLRGNSKWASCPLTQLGLVRVLSNPAFSPDALRVEEAIALLKKNTEHPRHEFWPDSLKAIRSLQALAPHIAGYRQVTDAYLLELSIRRNGRLATFDSGLKQLAVNAGRSAHVELVASA